MIGWTNQVENKLLNFQEKKYNNKNNHNHDNFVFSKRCKPFVIFLGFCFVIVNLVSMILICVALMSFKVVPIISQGNNINRSASLLWNYSLEGDIAASIQQKIVYSLSTYGITTIVFIILSIILLISFVYSWFHDNFFTSLDKKTKKLWFSLCISWGLVYLLFLIITAVGISIINQEILYPKNFNDAVSGNEFGLIFYIMTISSTNAVLGISSFGIFIIVLQFILLFSSVFWFIIFNFNVNFKKLKVAFSTSKKKQKK